MEGKSRLYQQVVNLAACTGQFGGVLLQAMVINGVPCDDCDHIFSDRISLKA